MRPSTQKSPTEGQNQNQTRNMNQTQEMPRQNIQKVIPNTQIHTRDPSAESMATTAVLAQAIEEQEDNRPKL